MKENYYGINVSYFKLIGLWQVVTQGHGSSKTVKLTMMLWSWLCAFTTVQSLNMAVSDYEFIVFMEKLCVNLTCLESTVKLYVYFLRRNSLREMLTLFRTNLLSSATHSPDISHRILNNSATLINSIIRFCEIMVNISLFLWGLIPLLSWYNSSGGSGLQVTPSWYPGDVSYFPLNVIVFIFEFSILLFAATVLNIVNLFFFALAMTASAQLELLSANLLRIEENAALAVKISQHKLHKQDAMYKLLRDCLIDHQNLLRLLKMMEEFFNPIFLFQVLMSTLIICLTFLQLNDIQSSGKELSLAVAFKLSMFLGCLAAELIVYSYGGQTILDKTEGIYWSLQNCGWDEGSKAFKSNVLIALICSRSPVGLTAGKFYFVNFQTFTQVIKASFSYFTFLRESAGKT